MFIDFCCFLHDKYIIPNRFTNKELIAHKDSLHNQLKKLNHLPSIVWGGYKSLPHIISKRCENERSVPLLPNFEDGAFAVAKRSLKHMNASPSPAW